MCCNDRPSCNGGNSVVPDDSPCSTSPGGRQLVCSHHGDGSSCNSGSSDPAGGSLGNCGSPNTGGVSSCDDGAPEVDGESLWDCRVPDPGGPSCCKGSAPDFTGRSSCDCGVPEIGGVPSGDGGASDVCGSSLCNCKVPDSGGGSSGDGQVPDVNGRSLPICGEGYDSSSEFPRFSNAAVTSSRDLWRTIAGVATAAWTTERIRRIRAVALSRRIFVGLCNVD